MNGLALTYHSQGLWKEAEELQQQMLERSKKSLGADHPATLNCVNSLAWTLKRQGRSPEAISLMKDCIRRRHRVLGVDHPSLVRASTVLVEWEAEQVASSGQHNV